MIEYAIAIHYITIAFIAILSVLGGGIGGGMASQTTIQAINIQPKAKNEIIRITLLGLALIETAAILALIIILFLFSQHAISLASASAQLGIACSIGIASFVIGIVSAFPVQEACKSVARQPFFSQKIFNLMLITQSIIQTGVIFGFLISLIIYIKLPYLISVNQGLTLAAAGIALGLGCIGPAIALSSFSSAVCKNVSVNKKAYERLLPFTFISSAMIETPLIFVFLIALVIVFFAPASSNFTVLAKMYAAALCISLGTLAPSINSAKVASSACNQITIAPQQYSILYQVSIFSLGLIDASAVYALLVSLIIIFL